MSDRRENDDANELLNEFGRRASEYFERVKQTIVDEEQDSSWLHENGAARRDYYWNKLPQDLRDEAVQLVARLVSLGGLVAASVRNAPLASEADQRDIMTGTKTMRASILLREFRSWNADVLHDEDRVLGVTPAGQSDDFPARPDEARRHFIEWKDKIRAILDLANASRGLATVGEASASTSARIRPGTAFIMMSMDPSRPELADVADAVKTVFGLFDIRAVRADDIEHEGLITPRILDEIRTAEFCFADLTGERPNVYYEVGYAHALGRRVILFRKAGTGLHFDLAGYNCPAYSNLIDLRDRLTRRLEEMTNRRARGATTTANTS